MDYKNIFGSDLSIRAVEDTKKNISWMKELYKLNDNKGQRHFTNLDNCNLSIHYHI